MSVGVGVRVIRGPHWQSSNADGGEGHLGTVKALLSNGQVRVLWDNGQEVMCKAGADGKFELRILDTAPVGVQHRGTHCSECGERDIYGMVWRCTEAACAKPPVTLCSICYVMDKHNIKHVFERVDCEGAAGEKVKKRSISLKIRASGIFPGAMVRRGIDWMWGDQDGSPGTMGEVIGFENVAPTSSRNMVRVEWPHGITNSYRLGLNGCVDIECVEETAGTYYYRDHLPLLDTTGSGTLTSKTISSTSTATTSVPSPSSSPSSQFSLSSSFPSQGAVGGGGGGEMGVGDKVTIAVEEEELKTLQANYGGTTVGMIQCIGKTGEVVTATARGALQVKFKRLSYRLNPQVLLKVPVLRVGDVVRIQGNLDQAKAINKHVGWNSDMDVTCGRVGQVVKIDEDGDAAVAFGRKIHLYAPACCLPALGFEPEVLSSSSDGSNHGARDNSGSTGNDQGDLHQKLMKMLAQMVQEDTAGSSGRSRKGGDQSEMGQVFKAISRGDTEAVQNVCAANPDLLRQVHKGLTLLMVACHEAQRDIINVLLDMGAPINAKADHDNTALGAALEGKKETIALLLLNRGADVRLCNDKGRNSAHVAAYNNLGDALREIIKKGADVNHTDQYGDAPLHDAIGKDNKEAIDSLMEAPALDLQTLNRKGFNMLQLACLRGNVYAVEKILQRDRTGVDDLMLGEFSALQIAITNDHVECARLVIVEGKASLDTKGSQGLTALHLACNEAYPRSLELLVTYGAGLNLQADDGNTPLHLAIGTRSSQLRREPSEALEKYEHRNRVRMACMLLEKGAYIDATNHNGAQPLQCCKPEAIRRGVKKFIEENPKMIRKQGGGSGDITESAVGALLNQMPDDTKRHLQEQCKQS
ncbi:hypothetical protein ACOMHN_040986 [Nucella lapillus]